jgi:hypothetical protein
MVRKSGTSRRYQPEPDGLRAMTALVVPARKGHQPLLAASQHPEPQTKPSYPTPVDHHYEHLRVGMRTWLQRWRWSHKDRHFFHLFQ